MMEVLIIISLSILSGAMSQSTCTDVNYNFCVQGLLPYIQESKSLIFPNFSISALPAICQSYDASKTCIRQFESDCSAGVKASILGMQGQFDYLCEEQRQGFISHRTCLTSPELNQRGRICNSTFNFAIQTDALGNYCGHIKAFVDCIYAEVQQICGQEAATWQKGYDESRLEPILTPAGCRLDLSPRAYCTDVNSKICTEPLKKYDLHEGWTNFVNFSAIEVREICGSYNDVRPCLDTFLDNCNIAARASFQGLHDTFTYICDDHFSDYERHSTCLQTPTLHEQGDFCTAIFQEALSSLLYRTATPEYRNVLLCRHTKTLLYCIENFVATTCGTEAAAWQRGFNIAQFKAYLYLLNCTFTTNQPTTVIPATDVPQSNCSLAHFEMCVAPLAKYRLEMDSAPVLPVSSLTDMCSDFQKAQPCLNMGATECPSLAYKPLNESYAYMCGDHSSDYMEFSGCLQRPKIHEAVQTCMHIFYNTTNAVSNKLMSICLSMNSLQDCVYDVVEPVCGLEAASVNRVFNQRLLKGAVSHLGLDCSPETSQPATSIGVMQIPFDKLISLILLFFTFDLM